MREGEEEGKGEGVVLGGEGGGGTALGGEHWTRCWVLCFDGFKG